MSKPFDVRDQLATFAGTAPLFPLPDVVHFPHLLLPLHIFEPRYREMVADAIEGDRLLAMALLKPGSTTTEGSPPIHNTVCLGRITANQQTADGRYYLVLQGLSRARIVREENDDLAYRMAELELHPDPECPFSPATASRTGGGCCWHSAACFPDTTSTVCSAGPSRKRCRWAFCATCWPMPCRSTRKRPTECSPRPT